MWSPIDLIAGELALGQPPDYHGPLQDSYGRRIDYLRISLTDACNLRCPYCFVAHSPRRMHESVGQRPV